MSYADFEISGDYIILATRKVIYRTPSGKSWSKKNTKTDLFVYRTQQYNNYISSIDFFNNFGDGASCRCEKNYTFAGYIPTMISSIAPFKTEKQVMNFKFLRLRDLLRNAGAREKEVIEHCHCFNYYNDNDTRYIEFIAEIDNDIKSVVFDCNTNHYVG